MLKLSVPIAAGILCAVPVAAQTTVQPQPIVVSAERAEVNRIVCKKEIPIGSRLGAKKVCLSVKEWQDRADADRDSTERIQQQAPTRSSG
jgi:hypothetical protein